MRRSTGEGFQPRATRAQKALVRVAADQGTNWQLLAGYVDSRRRSTHGAVGDRLLNFILL